MGVYRYQRSDEWNVLPLDTMSLVATAWYMECLVAIAKEW
jgi:hypothetical protein